MNEKQNSIILWTRPRLLGSLCTSFCESNFFFNIWATLMEKHCNTKKIAYSHCFFIYIIYICSVFMKSTENFSSVLGQHKQGHRGHQGPWGQWGYNPQTNLLVMRSVSSPLFLFAWCPVSSWFLPQKASCNREELWLRATVTVAVVTWWRPLAAGGVEQRSSLRPCFPNSQ